MQPYNLKSPPLGGNQTLKKRFRQKLDEKSILKGRIEETYYVENLIKNWVDTPHGNLEDHLMQSLELERQGLTDDLQVLEEEIVTLNEANKR